MPWLIITMNVLVFFLLLEQDVEAPVQVNRPKHDMPEEVRKQVYQALLARSKNGKLGKRYKHCCRSVWCTHSIGSTLMEAR